MFRKLGDSTADCYVFYKMWLLTLRTLTILQVNYRSFILFVDFFINDGIVR